MSLHRTGADGGTEAAVDWGEGVWSFQELWSRVCDAIGMDRVDVDPATNLRAELDVDSLHMAELVVFMDELGCELPEDLIPLLETAGDLHHHYVTRITAGNHREAP